MVAYGSVGRSALRAVRDARRKGIPVGFFRPITLWPFPDAELAKMALGARTIIVPELNCGQMVLEVERLFRGRSEVLPLNLVNGELFKPSEIARKIEEVAPSSRPARVAGHFLLGVLAGQDEGDLVVGQLVAEIGLVEVLDLLLDCEVAH